MQTFNQHLKTEMRKQDFLVTTDGLLSLPSLPDFENGKIVKIKRPQTVSVPTFDRDPRKLEQLNKAPWYSFRILKLDEAEEPQMDQEEAGEHHSSSEARPTCNMTLDDIRSDSNGFTRKHNFVSHLRALGTDINDDDAVQRLYEEAQMHTGDAGDKRNLDIQSCINYQQSNDSPFRKKWYAAFIPNDDYNRHDRKLKRFVTQQNTKGLSYQHQVNGKLRSVKIGDDILSTYRSGLYSVHSNNYYSQSKCAPYSYVLAKHCILQLTGKSVSSDCISTLRTYMNRQGIAGRVQEHVITQHGTKFCLTVMNRLSRGGRTISSYEEMSSLQSTLAEDPHLGLDVEMNKSIAVIEDAGDVSYSVVYHEEHETGWISATEDLILADMSAHPPPEWVIEAEKWFLNREEWMKDY